LRAIAAAAVAKGGRLFAQSAVESIDERDGGVRIATGSGSITAEKVVVATNAPINDRSMLHSQMAPYRTYAMAFTVQRGTIPDALYWDMGDPYHYVRLSPGPGSVDYLIAGGADHKSGEADDGAIRFEAVEAWIRALVPKLGREVARWSGQVMDTVDYCGFIGRYPDSENVFVATGDSGQGMTHGALAGLLLRDAITRGSSPWDEVYGPARAVSSGLVSYVRENLGAIANLAEQVLPTEIANVDELKPGEGGLLRDGLRKLAACRTRDGVLQVLSASCTHLGCIVRWNSTEQCWDCPCHGSHYAPDGTVLNGPAIYPLAAVE
jgi:nitrite reductase/ring-hydroxylating ferredoxin subunit